MALLWRNLSPFISPFVFILSAVVAMDPEQRLVPDFTLLGFAGLVDIVMEQGQISREEAIDTLVQRWVK